MNTAISIQYSACKRSTLWTVGEHWTCSFILLELNPVIHNTWYWISSMLNMLLEWNNFSLLDNITINKLTRTKTIMKIDVNCKFPFGKWLLPSHGFWVWYTLNVLLVNEHYYYLNCLRLINDFHCSKWIIEMVCRWNEKFYIEWKFFSSGNKFSFINFVLSEWDTIIFVMVRYWGRSDGYFAFSFFF